MSASSLVPLELREGVESWEMTIFDAMSSHTSLLIFKILDELWVMRNDSSHCELTMNNLLNDLDKYKEDLYISHLAWNLANFDSITKIMEAFFLLERLSIVDGLYLRFWYTDQWEKLSKTEIFWEEIKWLITSQSVDFEELLLREKQVLPKRNYWPFSHNLEIGSFKFDIIWWYNLNWVPWKRKNRINEIKKVVTTYLEKFMNKVIQAKVTKIQSYSDNLTKLPNRNILALLEKNF